MRNIVQFIKTINIKQVLTVFMAGCLLLISTACSQDGAAKVGTKAEEARTSMSNTYDKYDANQEYKGGMNRYNDDRRLDTDAGAASKAKTLVDTAKRRQADSFGDYVDNVTDRAKNTVEDAKREVPRTLKDNTEDAVDYVQDKSGKLQRNLSKVPGGVKDIVDEATSPAQDTLKDASKATRKTAKDIKGNFEDLS